MIKDLIQIIKPGIISGNLIAVAGGFFLASGKQVDFCILIATLFGTACIIASACIYNNYLDQDIDRLMERTKNRYFVTHSPPFYSVALGIILFLIAGLITLFFYTNGLSALLGASGFVAYIFIYTLGFKRHSTLGTIAGSISGATPPVIGYCSVTGGWDTGATLLFLLFCLWQMPHHYAISIFRLEDYQAARIPVLPAEAGIPKTLTICSIYIIGFSLVSISLFWLGYASVYYLLATLVINLCWLMTSIMPMEPVKKARKLFVQSIMVVTVHCLLMAF